MKRRCHLFAPAVLAAGAPFASAQELALRFGHVVQGDEIAKVR